MYDTGVQSVIAGRAKDVDPHYCVIWVGCFISFKIYLDV